jgi:hypothetical protein
VKGKRREGRKEMGGKGRGGEGGQRRGKGGGGREGRGGKGREGGEGGEREKSTPPPANPRSATAVNVGIMTSFTHCSDTTVSEKQDDFSMVTVSAYEQQNLANEDVTVQRSYIRAVDMSSIDARKFIAELQFGL